MQYEQSTEQVCTHFVKLKIPMVVLFVVESSSVKDTVTAGRRRFTLRNKTF